MTVKAQPLGPAVAELGESPFWSPEENCVWWVDVTGKQVLRTDTASGATTRWPTPHQIGFIARANGLLVVGMEQGLSRFDPRGGAFDLIAGTEIAPDMRFNDATVDATGRLWASTMRVANDRAEGAIWRFSRHWEMLRLADGLLTPNGLAFDAARSRLYFSDSHSTVRRVWHAQYDQVRHELEHRSTFMEFSDGEGRPDGATLDADGNYWIACLEAGTVEVRTPGGDMLRRLRLDPPLSLTKVALGPKGTLFATVKRTPERLSALIWCRLS